MRDSSRRGARCGVELVEGLRVEEVDVRRECRVVEDRPAAGLGDEVAELLPSQVVVRDVDEPRRAQARKPTR